MLRTSNADELYLTKRELHQQRFNNKHNLSIDQKIADVIEDLRADLEQAAILLSNGSPTKEELDFLNKLKEKGYTKV